MTAGAQTPRPSPTSSSSDAESGRADETPLTGAIAEKAKAAALEAVPDGTILRLETDAGGAAYEAHMRKADGTFVTVKMDKDFKVTATEVGRDCGPGRHGRHRGPRGKALTGEAAEKVKAAALEAVPGGTVIRAQSGPGDAAYHAHVRKSDGTAVVVELDKDFKVTATREHIRRMMPGQQG